MSVAAIDYIGDELLLNILPAAASMIIICRENCRISNEALLVFCVSSDLERIVKGGKFLVKVLNDMQRGLVLSIVATRLPNNCVIFTPRPEVISKYIPFCKFQILPCPSQSTPVLPKIISEQVLKPVKKLTDPFDIIYKETLDKYVETILMTMLKAAKLKSAKAQLKNLTVGVMTSMKKQTNIDFNFTPDEIAEAILADLEGNGIICIRANSVEYLDDWIEAYFGRGKVKQFVPGKRDGQQTNIKPEVAKKNENELNEILSELINSSFTERRLTECSNIGDLTLICKRSLRDFCTKNAKVLTTTQEESVLKQFYKYVLQNFYSAIKEVALELLLDAPQNYFSIKIERKV